MAAPSTAPDQTASTGPTNSAGLTPAGSTLPPVAPPASAVKVCRTTGGLLIRVEGRGTMKVSPAVREFAEQALAPENCAQQEPLVIGFDLSACEYMDSTFLGCLVCLHRGTIKRGSRLVVHADDEARQRLLGATHLEKVLHCVADEPEPTTEWVELTTATLDRQQFGWHIMECHRVLAELNCPQAAAFRAVADNLEQELGAAVPPGKTGNERTAKWRPGS